MTGSDQGTPPSQMSEAQLDEIREHVLLQRDVESIGMVPHWMYDPAAFRVDYAVALLDEVDRLRAENAALREIAEAVAAAESYHAEIIDAWVLLLRNPTLSYAQELLTKARALVQSS